MAAERDDLQARVDVVDLHDVGPAGGDPGAVAGHVDGDDRLDAGRERAELDRLGRLRVRVRVVLGAGVDPELQQAELLGRQRRLVLLVLGGHDRLDAMRGHLEEQALVGLAGDDRRAVLAPLEHPRHVLEVQLALGEGAAVAADALGVEDVGDLLRVAHRLLAARDRHRDRRRFFRRRGDGGRDRGGEQ